MRFLIGICTGAVVTLLVATAMDAPTHPLLNNARDLATTGWERLISATSNSLFESAQEAPRDDHSAAAHGAAHGAAQVEESPFATPATGSDPQLAGEAPAHGPTEEALDEQAAYAALESAALEPAPALPAPEPVAESPASDFWLEHALAAEQTSHASQPVWVPFHSQMSAEGFATRLSQALDHEFRVVRHGAGAYQVVFDAQNADEQALIMAQVTEITGQ